MTILPKAVYKFNAFLIKLPMIFFTELEQIILKFVWRHKRPWIVKTVLRKKSKTARIRIPDFSVYYKAKIIKTVCYWYKNRNRDWWKRIYTSTIKPTYVWSINLQQKRQDYTMSERQSNKWCWENWGAHVKILNRIIF